jgi:hypothetical protein
VNFFSGGGRMPHLQLKVSPKICGQVHDVKNIKLHVSIYSGSSVMGIRPKAKYEGNLENKVAYFSATK